MVLLESLVADSKTLLLVIDIQKDFCAWGSGYAYYERNHHDVIALQDMVDNNLFPFIKEAQEHIKVAYIQSSYRHNQFPEMPNLCIPHTPGWEFYAITPNEENGEVVLTKHSHDPFNGSLGKYLEESEFSTILIAGVTTDRCIRQAAHAVAKTKYLPIVIKDCVSTAGYKLHTAHEKTLKEFEAHSSIGLIESTKVKFSLSETIAAYSQ